jgi:hypothetical protein
VAAALSIARRIFWGVSGTKTAPLHTDLIFSGLRRPIIQPSESVSKEILDFLYSERLKWR